ncbi:MAG: hypothetical protein WA160_12890 [Pseudobdellovibrio sp.]
MLNDQGSVFFEWTLRLIVFAVFLQTCELLQLRQFWSDRGIYSKMYFNINSRTGKYFGNILFNEKIFNFLLLLNLVLLATIFISGFSYLVIYPFVIACLVFIRFGGAFNGGSDYMTALVLSVCMLHSLFPNSLRVTQILMGYLCFQVILSYFIAGLVKIKNTSWRSGRAMQDFFMKSNYAIPEFFKKFIKKPGVSFFAGWMVIAFECSFPIIFFYNGKFALSYIGIALIFHLVNFHVLGLNRFVWAWLSTYPILYYFASA